MSNILIVAAMAVALSSTPIFAQDAGLELPRHKRAIGVVVGLTQFDLSGTGNTLLVGARAETELQPWLIGEAALGVFRPEEQFLARATYFTPELQLQLQLPTFNVRPYIGVGLGYFLAASKRASQATASTAGGLRITVPGAPMDLRAELRVRGIGRNFSGSTAEWTAGASYRF